MKISGPNAVLRILPLLVLLSACGSNDADSASAPSSDTSGVSVDTSTDDITTIDDGQLPTDGNTLDETTSGNDGEQTEDAKGTWEPPPTAAESQPEPIEITEWMVATYADGAAASDLRSNIIANTVTYPDGGGTHYGGWWAPAVPGDNGQIKLSGFGNLVYVMTVIDVDEPTRAIVRADGISRLYVGQQQPVGDVYHSGWHRVPIQLKAGANLIIGYGFRRNEAPEITLESTPDELVFNTHDITWPHIIAGETHSQFIGLPVLNMTTSPLVEYVTKVIENDDFEATSINQVGMGPNSMTQVAFELTPKASIATDAETVDVTLRIEAPGLEWSYEKTVTVGVKASAVGQTVRRSFRSEVDGSAQYYGLVTPTDYNPDNPYALALSLHGAGVQAAGQAGSYGAKDWTFVAAATNRRPFGFDWESFGRLDGLEVMDHVMTTYPIDPERVYVTGHSMGGHGTWQFGTLFPGRFAVVGPSAGWISFATYGSNASPFPTGPFGWASLSSDTLRYIGNLANRAVYIIHGTADDNVPIGQAYTMNENLQPICDDLHTHWEEGAGHWWDGDKGAGADCVDWPPLFELMKDRKLDRSELNFEFTSPSPAISPEHSFVTLRSAETPAKVLKVTSVSEGKKVTLTTTNVRSMTLNGGMLIAKGVDTMVVNGETITVSDALIPVGPQKGKHPEVYGPLVQAFYRPFCLVYGDNAPPAYRHYAATLLETWAVIGNGHGCALPFSSLTDDIRANYNMIYLGIDDAQLPIPETIPLSWEDHSISVGDVKHEAAALGFVFPEGDRLSAAFVTTRTHEYLLFGLQPFSSRFWIPDWLVWADGGAKGAGFFDADWKHSAELSVP